MIQITGLQFIKHNSKWICFWTNKKDTNSFEFAANEAQKIIRYNPYEITIDNAFNKFYDFTIKNKTK